MVTTIKKFLTEMLYCQKCFFNEIFTFLFQIEVIDGVRSNICSMESKDEISEICCEEKKIKYIEWSSPNLFYLRMKPTPYI